MQTVQCPVCQSELKLTPTTSKKKGKPGLMLVCPVSGIHFRAFINDEKFITHVMESLEALRT